jgi:hypothetical protein
MNMQVSEELLWGTLHYAQLPVPLQSLIAGMGYRSNQREDE